jgi:hypothetical protein
MSCIINKSNWLRTIPHYTAQGVHVNLYTLLKNKDISSRFRVERSNVREQCFYVEQNIYAFPHGGGNLSSAF